MTPVDIGDEVVAPLHAIAERHEAGYCACTDDDVAADPLCAAGDDLADSLTPKAGGGDD